MCRELFVFFRLRRCLEGQGLAVCQSQVIRANGSVCLCALSEGFCSPAWALPVSRQLEKSSALKKVFIPSRACALFCFYQVD